MVYRVEDSGGNEVEETRTVVVIDNEDPVIRLANPGPIDHRVNTPFTNPTPIITDNASTEITSDVNGVVNVGRLGANTITYIAEDQSGNTATLSLTVNVIDDVDPVITLNGPATITLNEGDIYTETATAADNVDGNITTDIVFGGNFSGNTNAIGTFTRTYTVTDASGNVAVQRTRTIIVQSLASFNPENGRLTGRAGKTVTITLRSREPGSGNARVDVMFQGNRINLQQTCWGTVQCANGTEVTFSFTMPAGNVDVSGFHIPTGTSGTNSLSTIDVVVGTEELPTVVMAVNLGIPRP